MCQDEDENEPEDEFFRSFRIKTVTNEPGPQYYDTLKDRFVRHAQVPERTKALVFVFVFVFVLAHEQAIRILMSFFIKVYFNTKLPIYNECQAQSVKVDTNLELTNRLLGIIGIVYTSSFSWKGQNL